MPIIKPRTLSQGELSLLARLQQQHAAKQLKIKRNRHSLFDRQSDSLSKADND